tara:strand:- start:10816 stop:10968 length:153 start_codon:yes stop_codon:yes gene_type:complete
LPNLRRGASFSFLFYRPSPVNFCFRPENRRKRGVFRFISDYRSGKNPVAG